MFKNYLLVTFRNLAKNRLFTLINIIGLGLALAVCIVAYFNHMFNWEFDRNNVNYKEIYRVNSFRDMEGREQETGVVPATLGLRIMEDIPGIKRSARLARSYSPVKEGDDIFSTQISYVDPAFIDMFTFPLVYGDNKAIEGQGNVLISRKMAERLFGSEYPVGKGITIVDDKNIENGFTVAAVFEDLPLNCSFRIDILTHYDNFLRMWDVKDADWKFLTTALFIQVPDESQVAPVMQNLKNYTEVQNKAREDFKINRFTLVPLEEVGSNSRTTWNSGLFPDLHPAAVIAPPIMAIFILLIACFNFANTSIAIFSRRLKEIALRKTFGGQRKQLIFQFMFETFLICLLALFTGILIAEFLVPAYSSLWSYMSLEMSLTRYPLFFVFLLGLLLITGFMAGVYPAIYVSSFSPVNVMKGITTFKTGKISVVLLILQFTISVMSLVMGIVFERNAVFQKTADLGYDRDKIIVVNLEPSKYISYRNEMISNPKVISAAGTRNHIGYGSATIPVEDESKKLEVDHFITGPDYPATMGLRLVEGRLFDEPRKQADLSAHNVIVNQKLVDDFGWTQAIGKTIFVHDTLKLNVIGVVKDFYLRGLWNKINPSILSLASDDSYYNIAIRGENEDLPGILKFAESRWKVLSPNFVFHGSLQEDTMEEERDINNSILKINVFLAIAATLLSLIGMYNMVSLDIIRRTKEVGIRKIEGAPISVLMLLMSRKFLIVLGIASVAGCAGGYFLSLSLLDSIWDYFVKIDVLMLLIAALIMITATISTIVFKIAAAATRNPVDSLRYE